MNFQLPPWFALFLASDDGEVKIVDLEQMCFPEERQEWENCVNFGNVDALIYSFNCGRGRYCASLGGPPQLTDREKA